MQNWTRATQQYLRAKIKVSDAIVRPKDEVTETDPLAEYEAADELGLFLSVADGRAGKELLVASGQYILLGENYDGGGVGEVFFLDGTGLRKSTEPMGLGAAYHTLQGGKTRKPSIVGCSCLEAVKAAVQFGKKKPVEIVPFIRKELDRIARNAPKVE
jgi:hypothetical protein